MKNPDNHSALQNLDGTLAVNIQSDIAQLRRENQELQRELDDLAYFK